MEIGKYSTRCVSCASKQSSKQRWEKKGRVYPDQNYCLDCGVKIVKTATRCLKCAGIARKGMNYDVEEKPLNFCIECKREIGYTSTRCKSCASKRVLWTKERRQARSKSMKKLWREGGYDGREITCESPTKPEKDVMTALTELGIEYNFNKFQLGRYTYDFYLPNYDLLIEYDGYNWHYSDWAVGQGYFDRDRKKDKLAKEFGIDLIRLAGKEGADLTYKEILSEIRSALF